MKDKYDASGSPEGQYEPGSDGKVLANKRGITVVEEIEGIEFDALLELQNQLLDEIDIDRQLTTQDLCDWHQRWLGDIYTWAGNYRNVNMSKDDFQFAVAHRIHKLMDDFERDYLSVLTPCHKMSDTELINALTMTHVEFILVHPFRDGNGRLGRLLMTIMALQAGQPILDFTYIEDHKTEYTTAIQSGLSMSYEPMQEIIFNVLQRS